MKSINHVKAYILGLLIGGGRVDKNAFLIDLPFKKWGMEPMRMNIIAADILTKICQYFNSTYNFNVTYEIGTSKWLIKPMIGANISELKKDLKELHLPSTGFLLAKADITFARTVLKGVSIESFLSGIFDARASLTLSHRRFNADSPVVSIEIPGSTRNFKFVVQLCSWLTDLGSTTDQILYNHPNQHAASDPDYKGWKKGFKIRFLVRSFLAQHSFALQSKSLDITRIEKNQKHDEQIPCYLRKLRKPSPVTVHSDQNSNDLPEEVRNKLFFHYHHFCAVLGCPHAPVDEIKKLVKQNKTLINFYPRLSKGTDVDLLIKLKDIQSKDFSGKLLFKRKIGVNELIEYKLLKDYSGIELGLAYVFSISLKGKRHSGNMNAIIISNLDCIIELVSIGEGLNGPLLFINEENHRAFICSSVTNKLNQELISRKVVVKKLIVSLK